MRIQNKKELKVKEHQLANGLTVWLNEDHSQPKVFGSVVVKAGAKDCPDTGIAHYFEHMMFKGTDSIGTLNYAEERKLLQNIEDKYNELALTSDKKKRKKILKEINDLDVKSAEYIIPNEFNNLLTRYGGTGVNAATSLDYTVYYNTFSPQYMEQWLKINSERIIKPVFRLFRNELETVYEEKNMRDDSIESQIFDILMTRYFGEHPYAYPVIGSAENLRNPSLTEMKKFFNDYYVASNMALVLSGDFDSEAVFPIIDKYFSKIKEGTPPRSESKPIKPFEGRELMKVKYPVPFVKGMALAFRGLKAKNEDRWPMNIALGMLNNSNGTGFFDKLMVEHKLMGAMTINESMNDAGILAVAVMPKLFMQSYEAAEKLVWSQLNRLKEGDFSEEMFQSVKLGMKRRAMQGLENIDSRASVMMKLFVQGRTWSSYLDMLSHFDDISKDDVVRVANKYFTENYLFVTKTTGKYDKSSLKKPDLEPIKPKHSDASSSFAKELEKISVGKIKRKYIDFDKDALTIKLTDKINLYVTPNNINDIFTFKIFMGKGEYETPEASMLASYLQYLGTNSMTFDEYSYRLQAIGSKISFDSTLDWFIVSVTGFDNYFDETMKLVSEFLADVKADDKKLKPIIEEAKVAEKTFFKSTDNVCMAAVMRARDGERSRFLMKLSLEEMKKIKGAYLLDVFKDIQSVARDYHYCGTLSAEDVEASIVKNFSHENVMVDSNSPNIPEMELYGGPMVFFYDMPEMTQTFISTNIIGEPIRDFKERCAARLFSIYFAGGMSSLMFQEIREYRSLAYKVAGGVSLPYFKMIDEPTNFATTMSTQSDKTLDAISVLDNLINYMPIKPEKMPYVKQVMLNKIHNTMPTFRKISETIARQRSEGYTEDPKLTATRTLPSMEMDDLTDYYERHVKGRSIMYVVVGNKKKIDMKKLASYGKIVNLKKKDVYR